MEWLIIIALFLIIVILLFRDTPFMNFGIPHERHKNDPLKIIEVRYARGEIDQEEYERMKSDLEKSS